MYPYPDFNFLLCNNDKNKNTNIASISNHNFIPNEYICNEQLFIHLKCGLYCSSIHFHILDVASDKVSISTRHSTWLCATATHQYPYPLHLLLSLVYDSSQSLQCFHSYLHQIHKSQYTESISLYMDMPSATFLDFQSSI